jgi:hypothetical protein
MYYIRKLRQDFHHEEVSQTSIINPFHYEDYTSNVSKLLEELTIKQKNEVNDLETQIALEQQTKQDEADKLALENKVEEQLPEDT